MKFFGYLLAAGLLGAFLVGCGEKEPEPSAATVQQSSRLEDIQRRSGGDWAKLNDEDRKYLVDELAHGNEASARMLLGPPPAQPGQRPK